MPWDETASSGAAVAPGRVLFLNGASCAGKTTLASALQARLDGVWIRRGVDDERLRLQEALDASGTAHGQEFHRAMVRGFHRAAAGFTAAGNNVIVDHVLGEPGRLDDCLQVFTGLEVVFVGVHCPLHELERRAQQRSRRRTAAVRLQHRLVHAGLLYDVEVDTSAQSPEECARQVRTFLDRGTRPSAFDRMRADRRG